MKKNRFLKGMSAAFALALVTLATTFTSCEKENFNVEVTTPDATATISPIVLYVDADGNVSDVTSSAAINFSSGNGTYSGETISAQTITVTAVYNEVSNSVTVDIPALSAGESVYLTPIILLYEETEYIYYITSESASTDEDDILNYIVPNTTNYYWTTTRTYTQKIGVTEATADVVSTDADDQSYVNNIANTITQTYREVEETIEFTVYAHSQTEIDIMYNKTNVTLTITKTDGESTEDVGTVTYSSYEGSNIYITVNQSIPGHSHSPAGYGHGHGDDPNAGGGIIVAD